MPHPDQAASPSSLNSSVDGRPVHSDIDSGIDDADGPVIHSGKHSLPLSVCYKIHRLMALTRAMEERMIKMSKSGEGYFWIGGPGEEAFNVCLGLQVKKGIGPAYDYLHLHYRNSGVLLAMGMPVLDGVRQMAMRVTDSNSMGRNFVGHYAKREWNVVPVTSVIEIQYAMAPGTAMVQRRHGGDGVTVVVGGDAGTAEGDFASCMIWSTRPDNELPVLMAVTNNQWGISTSGGTQHGERNIIDRGKPFRIPGEVFNGNDPIASWHAIAKGLDFCRTRRRPYMLEAHVSRLYGHSSSSGAIRVEGEPDCLELFERRLQKAGALDQEAIRRIREETQQEVEDAVQQAMQEPNPAPEDVHKHTYAPSKYDAVYPDDYTGLPI